VVFSGPLGRLVAKVLNFVRGFLLEPVRIALLLRQQGVSLVHLNNSIIRNDVWIVGAMFAGLPCVTHERGINPTIQLRARFLARSLKSIICISQAVRDNLVALGLERLPLTVISNGLDPAEMVVTRPVSDIRNELAIARLSRLVGIVGNIKPWKGQEIVIRAMALVRERFPEAVCLLIGDTSPDELSYREAMVRLIAELGLNGRVLLTGFRADVANYINVLEIQVHASTNPEPFGRVLLEAMALGKPLVASNAGAAPEIVVEGETGLLFEPGNHDSLAAKLVELLDDAGRALQMGLAGRQRLGERFSIAQSVRETEALYQRILTD
jgi:glycosyltransferase involved in cell wall biosynthesis